MEYRKDLDKSQKVRHSEVISNKGYYIIMYYYDCHVHHETVSWWSYETLQQCITKQLCEESMLLKWWATFISSQIQRNGLQENLREFLAFVQQCRAFNIALDSLTLFETIMAFSWNTCAELMFRVKLRRV